MYQMIQNSDSFQPKSPVLTFSQNFHPSSLFHTTTHFQRHALQTIRNAQSSYFRCWSSSNSKCFFSYETDQIIHAQVRAVSSPTDQLVLSASRDTTAISWKRSSVSLSSTFTAEAVLKAGSLFVNAVAYIPPTPDAPEGKGQNHTGRDLDVEQCHRLCDNRWSGCGHQYIQPAASEERTRFLSHWSFGQYLHLRCDTCWDDYFWILGQVERRSQELKRWN